MFLPKFGYLGYFVYFSINLFDKKINNFNY